MPTSSRKSLLQQFKFIKVGGDCSPAQLIDPSAVCPISQELLSDIEPENRVSINQACYDSRALCDWLVRPESRERDAFGVNIPDNEWNNFHNNYCRNIRYRNPPQLPNNNNNNINFNYQWDFDNQNAGKRISRKKKYNNKKRKSSTK